MSSKISAVINCLRYILHFSKFCSVGQYCRLLLCNYSGIYQLQQHSYFDHLWFKFVIWLLVFLASPLESRKARPLLLENVLLTVLLDNKATIPIVFLKIMLNPSKSERITVSKLGVIFQSSELYEKCFSSLLLLTFYH